MTYTACDCNRPATDDQLIQWVLAGKPEGWRALELRVDMVVRHRIHAVLSRFRSVVGIDAALEVRSQFFLELVDNDMAKLRAFDSARGSLGAFIARLASNAAWDYVRSAARLPETEDFASTPRLATRSQPEVDPHESLVRRQDLARVQNAIRMLSPREQRLVQLHLIDENDADEVAETLAIKQSSVYTRVSKIRKKLRAKLLALEIDESRLEAL